jgi:hypothetical protein
MSAYAMRQTPGRKRRRFYTTLGRIERQRKIGDAHGSAVRARRSTGALIRPRRFGTPSASLGTIKSVATATDGSAARDGLLVGPPRKRIMVHMITPTTDGEHTQTEHRSSSKSPGGGGFPVGWSGKSLLCNFGTPPSEGGEGYPSPPSRGVCLTLHRGGGSS